MSQIPPASDTISHLLNQLQKEQSVETGIRGKLSIYKQHAEESKRAIERALDELAAEGKGGVGEAVEGVRKVLARIPAE